MPQAKGKLVHLLDGVSQAPPIQRRATQVESSLNSWTRKTRGLGKRPPTLHAASLLDPPAYVNKLLQTFTYGDGTDASAIGFSGDSGYMKVYSNRMTNFAGVNDNQKRLTTIQPLVDGSLYEVYADCYKNTAGTEVGIAFLMDDTGFSSGTGQGECGVFYMQYVDASTAHLRLIRREGGPGYDGTDVALSQAIAAGSGLRLGVTIDHSADTITPWTEPLGGGTRTTYTAWTSWSAPTWFTDGTHRSIGFHFAGLGNSVNGWQIDNLSYDKWEGTDVATYTNAFLHRIARDENERYRVVIINGDLKVFDENGVEVTVLFPHGKTYLDATTPNTAYRAVTHGDNTYILNRERTTTQDATEVVAGSDNEVIVWVREGDFNTNFGFKADTYDTWSTGTITYGGTPEGTDPTVREEINTDYIAQQLENAINSNAGFASAYTISRQGSAIHIKKNNGGSFVFEHTDGIGGLMVVIRRQVQRFDDLPMDLPAEADGFRVEVIGDPTTGQDNYWLKWEVTPDTGSNPDQAGRWVETAKPGEKSRITRTTMPHVLERGNSNVLTGVVCQDGPNPQVSSVGGGASAKTDTGFYTAQNDGGSLNTDMDAGTGIEYRYVNLEDADTESTEYTLKFDIQASSVDPGASMYLLVEYNDGVGSTNWSVGAVRYYSRLDGYKPGETLSFTAALGANFDIRISKIWLIEPTDASTIYVDLTNVTYLALGTNTPKQVDFGADDIFPDGTIVTVTVNSNANNYTCVGDKTGAEVATGIQPEVDNDTGITATVTSSGVLKIEHSTTTPTVVYSDDYDDTKTAILTEDTGLSDDSLVGTSFGVENETDGQSASEISSNTGRTITLANSLGAGATFDGGDVINVTNGSSFFTFKRVEWADRKVGDLTTDPFPSFIGLKLTDVFHTHGRLGILAGPNVVLSEAGDDTNFFRTSVRSLLDGDPIDTKSTGAQNFHAAFEFDKKTILTTGIEQFAIVGEPLLSPSTVRLPRVSGFETSNNVRPLTAGSRALFAQVDSGYTRVSEYYKGAEDVNDGSELTSDVQKYILGSPTSWAVSQKHGLVAILTDSRKNSLYVWSEKVEQNQRLFGGWHRWDFGTNDEILGVDIVDTTLGLVVKRDEGIFLETMPIDEGYTDVGLSVVRLLDRRMTNADVTENYTGGNTVITLPFDMPSADGTLQVVKKSDGSVYTTTRPADNQISVTGMDITAVDYYVGWKYTETVQLSPLYRRDFRTGIPIVDRRLNIRRVFLSYHDTQDLIFRVDTQRVGGSSIDYTVSAASPQDNGTLRAYVGSKNTAVILQIINDKPNQGWVQSLDWEGLRSGRS